MFFSDQKNNNYSGTKIPPQAIPTKYKDESFIQDTLDYLENVGIQQVSRNYAKYRDAYRLVEGNYSYNSVIQTSLFLSEIDNIREQIGVEENMEHYGFIEPILNTLITEYSEKPNPILIDAIDPLSKNDYINYKTEQLWKSINNQLNSKINAKLAERGILPPTEGFQSEEQQQQYQAQVDSVRKEMTPEEIEKDANENYRETYLRWAEATLEEDTSRFDVDEIDRDCLYDYFVTGKCATNIRVGYDFYRPERWRIIDNENGGIFFDPSVRNIEDGEYAGRIKYMTFSEIMTNYGHVLTAEDKELISNSKDYRRYSKKRGANSLMGAAYKGGIGVSQVPTPSYYEYENSKYLQDATGLDFGYRGYFPNQEGYMYASQVDKVRVIEVYWKSQQKIGYLTLLDPDTGDIVSSIVTDEILKDYLKENEIETLKEITLEMHKADPKPNTIVWDYKPQVWKGIKICKEYTDLEEDLYVDCKPIPYQLSGDSEFFEVKLPLVGLNDENSFVSRLQEYQVNYNLCLNAARDYLLKDWGVFFLFDSSYLPEYLRGGDKGESLTKMRELAKETGLLEIDGTQTQSRFNQFTAINMDMTQAAIGKLQMAETFKRMAYETVGLTQQRMGTPSKTETATGVKQNLDASYKQTEPWFDKFAKFQKRRSELLLNVAQFAKKEGIDGTVKYTDSDKVIQFINLSDEFLTLRKFRVSLENNTKRRTELEMVKNFFMQDNTIQKTLEDLAAVTSSDSVARVIRLGRNARLLAQAEQEKMALNRQKEIEIAEAAETERQRIKMDFEARENALDRQVEIYKQQILALGFQKDADVDNNNVSDVLQAGELALKELAFSTKTRFDEMDRREAKLQKEKESLLKEKELAIKDKEVEAKKYAADKSLEIARENKNYADLKSKAKK